MAHDQVLSRSFPPNGPQYWECVAILANLSHLDHAVRVLLRFLSQLARGAGAQSRRRSEERCDAESLLVAYVSEVESHLHAVTGRVRLSHRNISLVLAMARRAADALAVPGMFETVTPLIDQCHDLLLAGVVQDIHDVTDGLPYVLTETAEGQLVLCPREVGIVDSAHCRVTLRQMSAVVQRSKKALEHLRDAGRLPDPAVKGPRGTAHEWLWSEVRPILEAEFQRELPAVFPAQHR